MTPSVFEQLFGTAPAKVYEFRGSVDGIEDPDAYITELFATAVGTNLVECVITSLQSRWFVYTTQDLPVTGNDFVLVAVLPLPIPEIVSTEEAPLQSDQTTETP